MKMAKRPKSGHARKGGPPSSPTLELNKELDEILGRQDKEALRAWRDKCFSEAAKSYFKAEPFMRAAQVGDDWSINTLMELGEVASPESVMRCLDSCAVTSAGGQDSPSFLRRVSAWHALLDKAVIASPVLKKSAIEFLTRLPHVIPGPDAKGDGGEDALDWEHMRFSEVFTPETWYWTVPWRGPRDTDPDAYMRPDMPLSGLQLAWLNGGWEVCWRLLNAGLPMEAAFPASCWPSWTLKAAISGDEGWLEGLEGLALSDAQAVLKAQPAKEKGAGWDRLQAWARAAVLEEGLSAPCLPRALMRF